MLKIAICDDEKIIRDEINKLLKSIDGRYEVEQFQSGNEILETTDKFDIYFLDIEMPGFSGMEVAERLIKLYENPNIIFLTNHEEHAKSGYKVRAFRFLTKPIDNDQFNEAIIAVEKDMTNIKCLLLSNKGEKILIRHKDIVYIESLGDQAAIHTTESIYISNKPLRYFLKELGTISFFQVHKQFIVSLGRIVDTKNYFVKFHNIMSEIPISRRKSASLSEAILRYVKENGRMY